MVAILIAILPLASAYSSDVLELMRSDLEIFVDDCSESDNAKDCIENEGGKCFRKKRGSLRSIRCTLTWSDRLTYIVQGPQPDGPLHLRKLPKL